MQVNKVVNLSYAKRLKAAHFGLPLLIFSIIPFLIFLLGLQILRIFLDAEFFSTETNTITLIALTISILGIYRITTANLNLFPDIRLGTDGLEVRVFKFWFKWAHVPWENLRKLVRSPRFGPQFSTIWVVEAVGFPGSRLILRQYLQGQIGNGFIIQSTLPNYEFLLETIKSKSNLTETQTRTNLD
jgi:hypothetical protein